MICINIFYILAPFLMIPGTVYLITRIYYTRQMFELQRKLWVVENTRPNPLVQNTTEI
jgi:hypothetical protein